MTAVGRFHLTQIRDANVWRDDFEPNAQRDSKAPVVTSLAQMPFYTPQIMYARCFCKRACHRKIGVLLTSLTSFSYNTKLHQSTIKNPATTYKQNVHCELQYNIHYRYMHNKTRVQAI